MVLGMLEGPDLIIVLVIIMVMFGSKKLPELARGLGQAKREFEDAIQPDATTAPTAPVTEPKAIPAAPSSEPSQTVTLSRAEYEQLRGRQPAAHNETHDGPPAA